MEAHSLNRIRELVNWESPSFREHILNHDNPITQLQDLLTCSIHQGLMDSPVAVTSDCMHRFCSDCITSAIRMGQDTCPLCRSKLPSKRHLRIDHGFNGLLNVYHKLVRDGARLVQQSRDNDANNPLQPENAVNDNTRAKTSQDQEGGVNLVPVEMDTAEKSASYAKLHGNHKTRKSRCPGVRVRGVIKRSLSSSVDVRKSITVTVAQDSAEVAILSKKMALAASLAGIGNGNSKRILRSTTMMIRPAFRPMQKR